MEAKDTVMTIPQLWESYREQPKKYEVIAAIEKQAETTWQQAEKFFGRQNAIAFSSGIATGRIEGKSAGIKEVVKWIRNVYRYDQYGDGDIRLGILTWQAQLEKWGVDR